MRVVDVGERRDTAPTSDEELAASIARAREDTTCMLERARVCMVQHRDRALSEYEVSNPTADRSAPLVASLTRPATEPTPHRSRALPPESDANRPDADPRSIERATSLPTAAATAPATWRPPVPAAHAHDGVVPASLVRWRLPPITDRDRRDVDGRG